MGTPKHKRLTRAERITKMEEKQLHEAQLQNALKTSKKRKPAILTIIQHLRHDKKVDWYKYPQEYYQLQAFFNIHKKSARKVERQVFLLIIEHLYRENCKTLIADESYVRALGEIALLHRQFVREIVTWKRTHRSAAKQFRSFVRHCFAEYFVPSILDDGWFNRDAIDERHWFIHIGGGSNIRTANSLPVEMNKKMAHYFLQAPSRLKINEAFRWAQVMAMGGSRKLASHVAKSTLGRNHFVNESFWQSVIRFLINQAEVSWKGFDQFLDYLNYRSQLEPGYKLKGRSLKVLLQETKRWQEAMKVLKSKPGKHSWARSGVTEFVTSYDDDGRTREFYVIELRSANELIEEGQRMKNCVGTYVNVCREHRSAIFSLRERIGENDKRLATIEVLLKDRYVTQALGKCNDDLEGVPLKIVEKWKDFNRM